MKIGIVGGGGIFGAHAPAYVNAYDRCQVTAVAEPDTAKHNRIRELLECEPVIYDSYDALLDQSDVDAVDILLPHDLHLPASIAAAQTGKHILVEKLMARNIHECDQMIETCESNGVSLTVCHDRRYDSDWMALKSVVDSGVLGEIHFWQLEHNQNVLPSRDLPWAAFWDRLGGGAISSCLIHQIDALRWYGGEADRVTCMTRSVPERMEGETYGVVLAQMKSGALAELSINWATRQAANGPNALWYEIVRVTGSDGDAHYISGKGVFINSDAATEMSKHVELDGDPGSEGYAKIKTSGIAGHQTMISEWINMLSGRENQVSTTGADVRYTVEISEAAYLAEKEGSTISLPIESVPWGSR